MHPPKNNWDWLRGEIDHIDMETKLRQDLKYIMDAYRGEGGVEPYYFNDDDEEEPSEWGDFAFRWLTANDINDFHLPGPSPGRRSEFVAPVYSPWSDIMFAVAKDTEEYGVYTHRLDVRRE